jgi:hypothetical protein
METWSAKSQQPDGREIPVTHLDDLVLRLLSQPLYHHITPEYWITSKNDVSVTAADIKYALDGKGDVGGFDFDFEAHHWYFNRIDSC